MFLIKLLLLLMRLMMMVVVVWMMLIHTQYAVVGACFVCFFFFVCPFLFVFFCYINTNFQLSSF